MTLSPTPCQGYLTPHWQGIHKLGYPDSYRDRPKGAFSIIQRMSLLGSYNKLLSNNYLCRKIKTWQVLLQM